MMALGCLFIASKVEEHFRKTRDYINTFFSFWNSGECLPIGGDVYWNLKANLYAAETIIMRMLGFHTAIHLPYSYFLNLCKSIKGMHHRLLFSCSYDRYPSFQIGKLRFCYGCCLSISLFEQLLLSKCKWD